MKTSRIEIPKQKTSTTFKVHEDSNYLVIMTFGREEVISCEDYKKLGYILFETNAEFVTINDIIVQVKDIRLIEPTRKQTKIQKIDIRKRNTERQLALERKQAFEKKFFDEKYGKNRWSRYVIKLIDDNADKGTQIHILTSQDLKAVNAAYQEKYKNALK